MKLSLKIISFFSFLSAVLDLCENRRELNVSDRKMWITLAVCLVIFPLDLCQSTRPRDIRLPPTILNGPTKGDYYRSDDAFTLECKAHGVPEVSYEWKRNGVDMNLNGYNVKREVHGTIIIDPATSLDAGFYQCIAKNQFGTALSNTSYMQMAIFDSKGGTTVATKIVSEGDPFCVESQPTKSNPKPKSTWEMAVDAVDINSTPFTLSKRIQIAENGDLCFAFAKKEDDLRGKIYKKTEFNERLDLTAAGSYTKVTVNRVAGGPKEFAPTLGFSSPAQTVAVEGSETKLSCFFSGNPEPNIAWSGPKNTLPVGRYSLSTYKTILTIQNIQPSDEGDYICSSANSKGNKRHTMQIKVEAVPRFQSINDQPHDTNVTQDASVTFKCYTYAKPEATVAWLRNGQLLDLNNLPRRYRISSDKKSLTIENLCRDCTDRPESSQSDLGVIQCNASNQHGYAYASRYLNVLLKTNVAIRGSKNMSVDFLEEKQFVFQCHVTTDPSTPPIVRWEKVHPYGDLVRDEPPYVYVRKDLLIIMIYPNCSIACSKYLGEYRCVGDNGYSRDTRTITLSFKPPTEDIREEGVPWAAWKIILVGGAIGLFLLLIGVFFGFRSKRLLVLSTDERNEMRLPNLPSMNERVEYDSVAQTLEAVGNKEG